MGWTHRLIVSGPHCSFGFWFLNCGNGHLSIERENFHLRRISTSGGARQLGGRLGAHSPPDRQLPVACRSGQRSAARHRRRVVYRLVRLLAWNRMLCCSLGLTAGMARLATRVLLKDRLDSAARVFWWDLQELHPSW